MQTIANIQQSTSIDIPTLRVKGNLCPCLLSLEGLQSQASPSMSCNLSKDLLPSQNSGLKGQKPEDSFELYNLHIQPGGGTMLEGLIRGVPCHAVKLHSLLVLRPQLEEICPAATASAVGICNVRWAMRSKKSSKATRETTTPSALSDFQIDQLTMTVNEFRIVYAPTSHFSPTLPFSLCISWNVAPWIPVVCEAKKLLAASVLEAGWTATLEDLQTVAAA